MSKGDVAAILRKVLGPRGWLEPGDAIERYLTEPRGLFAGAAFGVALPVDTARVAAVVACCRAAGVTMVPQGGNTGLCGASMPDASGTQVILNLSRMNRVRAIDPGNNTITVDAGCILANVQEAARAADRYFPLSYASEGSAQIGGALSTNAGGVNVLRYGNARELALGLEVVLPDGQVWDGLRGLRKDNTGYDLKQLFIGAEGTLGIITAATLRLFPPPRQIETAWLALDDLAAAVELLAEVQAATGNAVSSCELMSRTALDFVLRNLPDAQDPLDSEHAWYLLIEATSSQVGAGLRAGLEAALAEALQGGAVADAVIAESLTQRDRLWRLREGMSEAQRLEGASIKHDVSVPVSRVPELIERGLAAVGRELPGIRPCPFGHLGDGNLHFNLTRPVDMEDGVFLDMWQRFNRIIHDLVAELGGSISAEHGIGQLKVDELRHYKSAVALDLMRTLKRAIDPDNLMNPGKVL